MATKCQSRKASVMCDRHWTEVRVALMNSSTSLSLNGFLSAPMSA